MSEHGSEDPLTVPVTSPMDQMDAIRKRNGEGRHMRMPWTWDLPAVPSRMAQSIPLRTTYRSLESGRLCCESSDPDVVRTSGGDTLEVLRHYIVTIGWEPWDPDETRRDEV
jgi:hypothetical protein